jgi:hypothetical protein
VIYKNTVRTSQEKHVSPIKYNRLMLLGETVAVCCENHTEHTNTLPNNIQGIHKRMVRFKKLLTNLFSPYTGTTLHCQQRELS